MLLTHIVLTALYNPACLRDLLVICLLVPRCHHGVLCCATKSADAVTWHVSIASNMVFCRFIERNGLPQSYKEQIVQWILDNTGGAVGSSAPTSNVDPFTGGGAYVPGSASSFPQSGSRNNDSIYANADPFTGGNGYRLALYSCDDAHQPQ